MTDTTNTAAEWAGNGTHAVGVSSNGHAAVTVDELLTAADLHAVGTTALATVVGVSKKSVKEWRKRLRDGRGDYVLPAQFQAAALAFLLDPGSAPRGGRTRAAEVTEAAATESSERESGEPDATTKPAASAVPDAAVDDGAAEDASAAAGAADDAEAEFARQAAEQRGKLAAGSGLADNPYAGMDGDDLLDAVRDIDSDARGAMDIGKQIIDAAIASSVEPGVKGRIEKALARQLEMSIVSLREQWSKQEAEWARANAPTPEQLAEMTAEAAAQAREERAAEAEALWAQVRPLATDPKLIDHLLDYIRAQGVVAEEGGSIGIFLTLVSRLGFKPLCLLRRGAAASGKNYLVEIQLRLLSSTAYVQVSGGSPRSLPYYGGADDRTALSHKVIYVPEAASLAAKGQTEDPSALMLRTLISEGRLVYQTVVTNEDGPPTTLEIVKDGPIASIVTSARDNIEHELLTRLVMADTDESRAQTTAVMASVLAQHAAGAKPTPVYDIEAWKAYHRWLDLTGPYRVVVPYARSILAGYAGMQLPLRARRDVSALIAAISASAIAHKAQRIEDGEGRIAATLDDYQLAYRALACGLSALYKPTASAGVVALVQALEAMLGSARAEREAKVATFRATHDADAALPYDLRPVTTIPATVRQLMAALGVASRDSVSTRLDAAVSAGVIEVVNPTAPRTVAREYRIVTPSAVLLAQMAGSAAMPTPDLVAHYVEDPQAGERAIADHEAALAAAPGGGDGVDEPGDVEGAGAAGAADEDLF
jgi:hypothetical protein